MTVLLRTDLLGELGVGGRTTGNDGGTDQSDRVGDGLTWSNFRFTLKVALTMS